MNDKTKQLILGALFIALCFIGANIKIMGSIAFDSMPAFLATLILGWGWGAVIGGLAHLLTALTAGFPMSLPVHLITAVMMAVTMIAFHFTITFCRKTKLSEWVVYILGAVVAVLFNVPISLLCLAPILTFPVAMGLVPVLLPAAAINVVLAIIIYRILPEKYRRSAGNGVKDR